MNAKKAIFSRINRNWKQDMGNFYHHKTVRKIDNNLRLDKDSGVEGKRVDSGGLRIL